MSLLPTHLVSPEWSGCFSVVLRTQPGNPGPVILGGNLVEWYLSHQVFTYTSVTYATALPIYLESGLTLNPYHYLLLPLQGSLQSQHPPHHPTGPYTRFTNFQTS